MKGPFNKNVLLIPLDVKMVINLLHNKFLCISVICLLWGGVKLSYLIPVSTHEDLLV